MIFAAGVHAHRWGLSFVFLTLIEFSKNKFYLAARVNSMYRVRDEQLTLIIKADPQQTHKTYLLSSPVEILDGDYLVGQCVYDNNDHRTITVG